MLRPNTWRSWIGLSARAAATLLGMHHHFQVARLELLHAALEHDAAAVDEHDVGEDVLDLLDLMGRDEDGAAAVEVVVQQRVVELLAKQDVEAERRLVQHQQAARRWP